MSVNLRKIQQLRQLTGAGVMDAKRALEKGKGDFTKAKEILRQQGLKKAAKKEGRETNEGYVGVYEHHNGKLVGIVVLLSETDFVARNRKFRQLAHDLAMQVCSVKPQTLADFLGSPYIKDPKLTVKDLLTQAIAVLGENIKVKEATYFEV